MKKFKLYKDINKLYKYLNSNNNNNRKILIKLYKLKFLLKKTLKHLKNKNKYNKNHNWNK